MERKQLIRKLNWFYSLERQQYEMYSRQADTLEEEYISRVFLQLADIERRHADKLEDYIIELGGRPTRVGGLLGTVSGTTLGKLSGLVGRDNLYTLNIRLENKAIDDYKEAIEEIEDNELKEILWTNKIEEDLHRSWFQERRKS